MVGASQARLAELVGSLSVATDHAAGLPPETAIRTSLLAVRLAKMCDVQGFELVDVYYTGLLRFLGCSAYSYEMAARFAAGDDLSLLRELTRAEWLAELTRVSGDPTLARDIGMLADTGAPDPQGVRGASESMIGRVAGA